MRPQRCGALDEVVTDLEQNETFFLWSQKKPKTVPPRGRRGSLKVLFTIRRPTEAQLQAVLQRQQQAPFSYPEVGSSRQSRLPGGYSVDHHRRRLGSGHSAFLAAKRALQRWAMFDIGWLYVFPSNVEIREDLVVAVVASHLGFWSVNVCRIVYVIDSEGSEPLYAFAYGTLPEHAESGEERFTIAWDRSDNSVWYDIRAFSRPKNAVVKMGYPFSRLLQKRFARDSMAALATSLAL